MNWKIGDKFLIISLAFYENLSIIVLYKNINYKVCIKTAPKLSILFYKEEFNACFFNKVSNKPSIVAYEWNGYYIYSLGNKVNQYISAKKNFVPLKVLK